jgi:hypothetical protein
MIRIVFTASNAGTRTAMVAISNDAPGHSHGVLKLGTGTGFSISHCSATLAVYMVETEFQYTVPDNNIFNLLVQNLCSLVPN